MWGWNCQVWEKSKGTVQCDKRTAICDIGIAQYEDETIKCEKKSKETAQCEKRTVTCDVGTTKCENGTIKHEKKVREPPNMRK